MTKQITQLFTAILFLGFNASVCAGVIYNIESTLTIGGTDYYGSGYVDVDASALTASNNITFDSGAILDFQFNFDDVTATIADSYSPSTEGFRTDASGEIVAFLDETYFFADFWTSSSPSRGVFFHESNYEFRARSSATGGNLVMDGTYTITRATVSEPGLLALLLLGVVGLPLVRRKS